MIFFVFFAGAAAVELEAAPGAAVFERIAAGVEASEHEESETEDDEEFDELEVDDVP